jgi:hypothetical protein
MWQLVVRLTGAKVTYRHAPNFELQDINLLSVCRQQGSSKSRNSSTNLHGDKSKMTVDLIIEVPSPYAAEWEHILWKDIHRSMNDAFVCNMKKTVVRTIQVFKQLPKHRGADKSLARPGRKQATRMSKSSWMMDPTRSREMPSCSAIDLAEIRRSSKIRRWILSIISGVVWLRTYQHPGYIDQLAIMDWATLCPNSQTVKGKPGSSCAV